MKPMKFALPLLLSACSMAPRDVAVAPPVPETWPSGPAYGAPQAALPETIGYRGIFADQRLQSLIEQALESNRDLKVAAANVMAARAQVRIQRAEQLPQLDLTAGATHTRSNNGTLGNQGAATGGQVRSRTSYSAQLGITAFELDLFGRLASLSEAEQNRYLASEAGARATRLALVGDIADGWLAHAADASLLQVALDTVASAQRTVALTRARLDGGIAPRSDLRQAEQILATAEADVARQRTALAQDINGLQLLVGVPIANDLLPDRIEQAAQGVKEVPAGVDSRVLLRRPDVIQAEYLMLAANAEIGAARAAMFPRISLTGLLGFASNALSGLFTGGAFRYSGSGDASYAIFQAGAAKAGVRLSQAQRDAALATYEKSIQSAFRDVADGLARRGTIDAEMTAIRRQAVAAEDGYALADARYRRGVDTFLSSLVAQRAAYSARRDIVAIELEAASNRVALFRALGGDARWE